MPEDLTPHITMHDSVRYERGQVRNVTIVRFFVGRHGPFEEVFDRTPTSYAIDEAIRKRTELLTGRV